MTGSLNKLASALQECAVAVCNNVLESDCKGTTRDQIIKSRGERGLIIDLTRKDSKRP